MSMGHKGSNKRRVRHLSNAIYERITNHPIALIVADADPSASEKIVDDATMDAFARARAWKQTWAPKGSENPVSAKAAIYVRDADRIMAAINSSFSSVPEQEQ